jgi:hypothetical protein
VQLSISGESGEYAVVKMHFRFPASVPWHSSKLAQPDKALYAGTCRKNKSFQHPLTILLQTNLLEATHLGKNINKNGTETDLTLVTVASVIGFFTYLPFPCVKLRDLYSLASLAVQYLLQNIVHSQNLRNSKP